MLRMKNSIAVQDVEWCVEERLTFTAAAIVREKFSHIRFDPPCLIWLVPAPRIHSQMVFRNNELELDGAQTDEDLVGYIR